MNKIKLTCAHAIVRYLISQKILINGKKEQLFAGVFGIFGHGNVACLGQALQENQKELPTWRGHHEQNMALTGIAYARAKRRKQIFVATSSVGPGSTNMVTAAAVAMSNRLPLLLLPGDTYASRIPDPVLQQVEHFNNPGITQNDAFKPVTRYFDRITRPEQILQSLPQAIQIMLDPADCGPACLSLSQDIQGEVFDYPEEFFKEKVHTIRRPRADDFQIKQAAEKIKKSKCPIVDTWWQTETGGMMLSPLPGLETVPLKPGSATRPIPGVDIDVVDENGNLIPLGTKGYLVIKRPWPGMLLTLWGDDKKYKDAYWSKYENIYYSGDYALKDSDGYFWLLGRADDMLKVAGHRIGTAELESSLVSHNDVAEAAVCGIPDKLKGESIIAFVVLKHGVKNDTNELKSELIQIVRKGVGPIATPDQIYFVSKLPKTRSGKIMRRLLKAIISNNKIGDLSTLEDRTSVTEIQTAFNELQKSVSEN